MPFQINRHHSVSLRNAVSNLASHPIAAVGSFAEQDDRDGGEFQLLPDLSADVGGVGAIDRTEEMAAREIKGDKLAVSHKIKASSLSPILVSKGEKNVTRH